MKKHSPESNCFLGSQLSTVKKNPRPSTREGKPHSHPHAPSANRKRSERRPDSLTKCNEPNKASFNKMSFEAVGGDLHRQHVEDAAYLQRRREIHDHYRSMIEHDQLRCMMELERIKAGIMFLGQQDALDREWEKRLLVQQLKLRALQTKHDEMRKMKASPEAVTNPLFNPQLVLPNSRD